MLKCVFWLVAAGLKSPYHVTVSSESSFSMSLHTQSALFLTTLPAPFIAPGETLILKEYFTWDANMYISRTDCSSG